MTSRGREISRSRSRSATAEGRYAVDDLDRELAQSSFNSNGELGKVTTKPPANLDDRAEESRDRRGAGTATKVLIGLGGTALGAGVGTALVLTAPVTLPIAIAAGAGTALVTWLSGAALTSNSNSESDINERAPRTTEEKARVAVQGATEWQLRFRELSDQVFNRRLRERLIAISQLVEEITVNLQHEPEDIRSEPIFVTRLERVERHLKDYVGADVDFSEDQRSRVVRTETEEKFDLVRQWLEEVKQKMFDNNEFSLKLGNRTFEAIFNENGGGAAATSGGEQKQ